MRKSTLIALLVAGSLLIPAAVYASHQFTDVPDSNQFHSHIAWMKDNNITVGCNPPANTQYCPGENVTRGQMAAFMKRLAENNVVDAATLDGLDSNYYQGSVAGDTINSVTPVAGVRTLLSSLSGFVVPQNGGALDASADLTMIASGPDIAVVWLEIDGSGACDIAALPDTFGALAFAAPFAHVGTSTTAAATAGSHRVDLCALTTGGLVGFGAGALTVQWVETTQIGTTAGDSNGLSPEEKLEELSSATFGE